MKFITGISKAIWLLIIFFHLIQKCYFQNILLSSTKNFHNNKKHDIKKQKETFQYHLEGSYQFHHQNISDTVDKLNSIRLTDEYQNSNKQPLLPLRNTIATTTIAATIEFPFTQVENINKIPSINYQLHNHHQSTIKPQKLQTKMNFMTRLKRSKDQKNENSLEELLKNMKLQTSSLLTTATKISTEKVTEIPLISFSQQLSSSKLSSSSLLPNHQFDITISENYDNKSNYHEDYDTITTTALTIDKLQPISNFKNNSNDDNLTICFHEDDKLHMDCIISENETCFGDPEYCNYTYDEYMKAIHAYMFPTTSEWILICSHMVVFIMGLVNKNKIIK